MTQSIYFTLSTPIAGNIFFPKISYRGNTTLNFVLTGISEEVFDVLFIDIDWGDKTPIVFLQKDLLFNYKEQSIFDEIRYGKLGGSVATIHTHTFSNTQSTFNTSLTSVFTLTYNNGVITRLIQPIDIYDGSFYDKIGDLNVLSTQITPDNDTFVVFECEAIKQTTVAILST